MRGSLPAVSFSLTSPCLQSFGQNASVCYLVTEMMLPVPQSFPQMVCESSHNSHVMFFYGTTWLDISDVYVVLGAEDVRAFRSLSLRIAIYYNPFHKQAVNSYYKDQGCASKVLF